MEMPEGKPTKDEHMSRHEKIVIPGTEEGCRLETRVLEERIQAAAGRGCRHIEVHAHGQHGIGGRLRGSGRDPVRVEIHGYPGQRVGSMGSPGTRIEVHGPASDDVGWLNAGATIVVHGDTTNGTANAMAQGKVYVAGDIGARGMTMTKSNPRFLPPELWVLGGAGDSFAEFMAGGIAVVCGVESHYRGNILGHRPCVGMVGGKIFFRGAIQGFSERDAKLLCPDGEDWEWLVAGMKEFLKAIGRGELLEDLTRDRSQWRLLAALSPHEKKGSQRTPMSRFRSEVWDRELGKGGIIGDLSAGDRSPVPLIATGDLRRFVPAWENHKYLPPCQAGCPSGIPVQKRWELVRSGAVQEAMDLALEYTPFPATICGYLCPHLCMESCTRRRDFLKPVDVSVLGRASAQTAEPVPGSPTGRKVAIIGAGPAGLSVAWQLWMKGHTPVVFDLPGAAGGKIASAIPGSRFPVEVFAKELRRVMEKVAFQPVDSGIDREAFEAIRESHDFTVIASGAQSPRTLKIPGEERALTALDFLRRAKRGEIEPGRAVVIIGAGNVGCDVATEAHRLGARDITLIDIQEPASFGPEREAAREAGARFLWPVSARAVLPEGVQTTDGEILKADTVVVAIGDLPDLSFLPAGMEVRNGFLVVDDEFCTSDPRVYAIGDSVKPGLLTDAIGAGRRVSLSMDARLKGAAETFDQQPLLAPGSVKLAYYAPGAVDGCDIEGCAVQCASCGGCRDCGVCEAICPQQAISRRDLQRGGYEYLADGERCIGCGFCAGACPCGIWELHENRLLSADAS
jgi:NADPH-dependent glutamate synthase beta subunit-like oxidoreductase/glutamate synthase domain-containing protein 3/NAD-dependent dihydropyrimidine dehydrogenase PreA subunit